MGRRKQSKLPTPPKVEPAPVIPATATDMTNVDMYQKTAMADDMTMASTILTKPKRKKKLDETDTLMGSY
jgi:phage pi2 protein 07|tara:strand:+ start:182 stop:391 length:210 start_codon:yes stop_codon:yes gene_type:complete